MTATITTERVRFDADGTTLVGDLHRPVEAAAEAPAIVLAGSWTTVKEQMAGRYARRLAERGFVTLAFDFTGTGQSAGAPRDVEDPTRKAADLTAAVRFLRSAPGIDADRVGALGVCAGAGYVATAAAGNDEIRSLAFVAPWLHDADLVEAVYGGADGVAERLTVGRAAADRYAATGEVSYVPAISETDPNAAMFGPFEYYLDPNRGAIPEWSARFAEMAWPGWLTFDPIPTADRIAQPVLIVHGRDGAVPDGAQAFHDRLTGPKDLHWTAGTQFDFYDQAEQVDLSVDLAARHFEATL
ncbi:MAG: alpha/beta fold hydrolase [Actinomycetota bacterium]